MANLEDLKQSMTEMDEGELRNLLLGVRQSRRVSKKPPPTAKATSTKAEVSIDNMLNALSPEAKADMLAKLLGGK
jgi:hypothetical protein